MSDYNCKVCKHPQDVRNIDILDNHTVTVECGNGDCPRVGEKVTIKVCVVCAKPVVGYKLFTSCTDKNCIGWNPYAFGEHREGYRG